ncbi:hypothetical protein Q8A67_006848 [Cirrhinus molitorella]|uniref:Uncharacterized protein n=1 Tax=Cirrhinus molitorella TaxID=172907 RepID=A0AA88TR67_9TELE|nr:hypothetical protein Q8A67_006848 [Cirrhinus molitorella]
MPRRCCHAYDSYGERALCLGTAHAEAALNETECPHCEDMSLVFLRSRAALFRARPRFSRPPALFLPGICEEKAVGQRTSALGCGGNQRSSLLRAALFFYVDQSRTLLCVVKGDGRFMRK